MFVVDGEVSVVVDPVVLVVVPVEEPDVVALVVVAVGVGAACGVGVAAAPPPPPPQADRQKGRTSVPAIFATRPKLIGVTIPPQIG